MPQGSAGRAPAGVGSTGGTGAGPGAQPGMMGGTGASRPPRTELDAFVIELVRAYPRAVISTDGSGRIPLTDAIYDWIEYSSRDGPAGAAGAEEGMEAGVGQNEGGARPSQLGMGSARGGSERIVSNLGSDRLEGMSELMGQDEAQMLRNTGGEMSTHTGKRSMLDNISLPSAFRSAYSSSGKVDDPYQQSSRAAYRNNHK